MWTPLIAAARNGQVQIAKLLLKAKADVNATSVSRHPFGLHPCQDPSSEVSPPCDLPGF